MIPAHLLADDKPFAYSEEKFDALKTKLHSPEAASMSHSNLEEMIQTEGRELLRRLLQDHLTLRAHQERQSGLDRPVVGADGQPRTYPRSSARGLLTLFGPVRVERMAYSAHGATNLHPLDAVLNLPEELHSHGVRRRVAEEASKASFDETVRLIRSTTGAEVAKRQVEELAVRAAQDFDGFYQGREVASPSEVDQTGSILVITVDGKGVVMRRQDLREATRKAAERRHRKFRKRLSQGEKPHAKRMATVAAVYTIEPFPRTVEDIVGDLRGVGDAARKAKRPRPENKRVWASLAKEPEEAIAEAFDEALRRDPARTKRWVALVDGNENQLKILRRHAKKHGVGLTIVLDVIHVIEYLWKAAWTFCEEGSSEAEAWVTERFLEVLRGKASYVAAGIRRSATLRGLSRHQRKPADTCANYLLGYQKFLRYDRYLSIGFPIATGVIEGACRHLVKDRMDLTGARWSLTGAEAVLQLRSLRASGDFEEYWHFHLDQERYRNHTRHYAEAVPRIRTHSRPHPHLHRVK